MMENNEESSLLLPKNRRRTMETPPTRVARGNYLTETDLSRVEFQWKLQKMRFYLVELMVLILVFAYNLSATVLKNRIIFQTCTNIFAYNSTDCQKLSTRNNSDFVKKSIEEEIQPYAARIFMITSVVQSIVPALCGTFIGAWSDRFGRKPLLVASFTGYFLFYFVTSLISHLSDIGDVSPWYYLLASLPLSLLGDGVTYSVATLCYISDVSTAKERPYRMTFYEAVMYIGLMSGSFSSGYLYEDYTSSTLIFSISALCILFATLIIIFIIPESLNVQHSTSNIENNGTHTVPPEVQNGFRNLFDFNHIRDMFRTCFTRREYEIRFVILLIISSLLICAFIVEGSISVFYLFVREKFQWTVKEYTTFEAFSILVPIVGNIFGILLLRKVIKMKLLNLATLGLLSQTCNWLMKGFAAVSWQLYFAVLLGVLKSIVNPMLRTVLSNLLPAKELGKIFSFISALEAFMPFVASPLYTIVYTSTLKTYPSFFNILSANLFLLAIACILVVFRKKQKYPAYYSVVLN